MSGPQNAGKGNLTSAPLQGHYSLKSSPFNSVSGKLTTQSLVVDHMNAHYRKLVKAKPAIDTGIPLSYIRSQKVRDRQRREALMRGDAPPSSSATPRRSSRPASARSYGDSSHGSAVPPPDADYLSEDHSARQEERERYGDAGASLTYEEAEQRRLAEYARALTSSSHLGSTAAGNQTMVSLYGGGRSGEAAAPAASFWQLPQSARSAGGASAVSSGKDTMKSISRGQQLALAKDTLLRKGMSADILDKRHHKFTEPAKSFTPRTLKKDVQSRLSSYKYYNKPQPSSAGPASSVTSGNSPDRKDGDDIVYDAADSVILDETLVSRDFERGSSIDHDTVPPLEMSLDTDHMKWLREQSAEHRMRSKSRPNEINSTRAGHETRSREPSATASNTLAVPRAAPRRPVTSSSTRQQISKEDEELMYLNFVTQVTNDILMRGIFSDRVLQQVFEEHVTRERDSLDECRMRALLDTLREDLGITTPPSSILLKTVADAGASRTLTAAAVDRVELHTGQLEPSTLAGSAFARPRSSKANASTVGGRATDPSSQVSKAAAAITSSTRLRATGYESAEVKGLDDDTHRARVLDANMAPTQLPPSRRESPAERSSSASRNSDDAGVKDDRAGACSMSSPEDAARSNHEDNPSLRFGTASPGNTAAAARVQGKDDGSDETSDVELLLAHERSLAGGGELLDQTKAASDKDADDDSTPESDFEEYRSDEYD